MKDSLEMAVLCAIALYTVVKAYAMRVCIAFLQEQPYIFIERRLAFFHGQVRESLRGRAHVCGKPALLTESHAFAILLPASL